MDTRYFLKENRGGWEEKEILLSERFVEEGGGGWRIRPMTQRENEEIWKSSQKNQNRYEAKVLAESVCFPDLKEAALQNSYGVMGEEKLLLQMLTPGEYERLRQEVERINGGGA